MIALPFIEVVGNIHRENMGKNLSTNEVVEIASKILRLQKFYSKPFDIGMLVNPIEKPNSSNDKYNMETVVNYRWIFNADARKWKDAEDKKLFTDICIAGKNPDCGKGVTLNDFISDYHRAGIELHWKQQIIDKYFKTKT